MAVRRELKFASLTEAVLDAERLAVQGYEKVGVWDLSQCCGHLASWLTYPLDGFPVAPLPIRAFMWIARNTFGPAKMKRYIADGAFPSGAPTAPQSVPVANGDDAEAVARFKAAVERLLKHSGKFGLRRSSDR